MVCRKLIFLLLAATAAIFCGCTMEEFEIKEEGHIWRFEGLVDDTTACVRVTLDQWGEEHDHHWMGYDDDFHWTKDIRYYSVRLDSYWRGSGMKSAPGMLQEVSKTDDYGLRVENLDSASYACGVILLDRKGKSLDTLETGNCGWKDAVFVGSYVRIGDSFYLVKDGKFPTQKPTYRFEHTGLNVKFIDANGDYIVYGGKP